MASTMYVALILVGITAVDSRVSKCASTATSECGCHKASPEPSFLEVGSTIALQGLDMKNKEQCKRVNNKLHSFLEIQAETGMSTGFVGEELWCEDCSKVLIEMNAYFYKFPDAYKKTSTCSTRMKEYCSVQTLLQKSQCEGMVQCLEDMYCPNNPCQTLAFTYSHTPNAICEHSCMNCQACPQKDKCKRKCHQKGRDLIDTITGEPCDECGKGGCNGLPCGACSNILDSIKDSCTNPNEEERQAFRDGIFTEFCPAAYEIALVQHNKTHAAGIKKVCEMVVSALNEQFWPEHFCDGLTCLCGSKDQINSDVGCPVCGTLIKCDANSTNMAHSQTAVEALATQLLSPAMAGKSAAEILAAMAPEGPPSMVSLASTNSKSVENSLQPPRDAQEAQDQELAEMVASIAKDNAEAQAASNEAKQMRQLLH